MKLLFCISSFVVCASLFGQGNEGHPIWWWEVLSADMVAVVDISYDAGQYFVIESHEGKAIRPTYYLAGKVKFKRIVYVNRFSRYVDSYAYYVRNPSLEGDLLIPATEVHFSCPPERHGQGKGPVLRPSRDWDTPIDTPDLLVGLNQCYVFPIGHLVLDSIVSADQTQEILELTHKRNNNLITD